MSGSAPAAGMQRIPIPSESYQHRSTPLSNKRLLNFMAEKEPADAFTAIALVPTHGLDPWITVGPGPHWAANDDHPGLLYVVSGDHLYRVQATFSPPTVTDLGYVGSVTRSYDIITIAVGSTACCVVVPPNAFVVNHTDASLNQVTDPAFAGAQSVCELDGYYAFAGYADDASWFISKLLDPTTFDALDFAFADGLPTVLRRIIAFRGQLWLLGEGGIEVWYDNGAQDFPFRRVPGAVIPIGVATPRSVSVADSTVWWIGTDNIVYRSNGYAGVRVSTTAIEQIIETPSGQSANCAFTWVIEGHTYYMATFGSRTIVYDASTSLWHERSSSADGTAPWRALCAAVVGTTPVFGDALTGTLMLPNMTSSQECSVEVARQVILPPLRPGSVAPGATRAFVRRMRIEAEVGPTISNTSLLLEWSDDGGIVWKGSRTLVWQRRMIATRMGSFDTERVHRITTAGRASLYGVLAGLAATGE